MKEIYKVGNIIKRTFKSNGMNVLKGDVKIYRIIEEMKLSMDRYNVKGEIIYSNRVKKYITSFILPKENDIWVDEICSEKELLAYLI